MEQESRFGRIWGRIKQNRTAAAEETEDELDDLPEQEAPAADQQELPEKEKTIDEVIKDLQNSFVTEEDPAKRSEILQLMNQKIHEKLGATPREERREVLTQLRRERAVAPEAIDDELREKVVIKAEELETLQAYVAHLMEQVRGDLPTEVSRPELDGASRATSWEDIKQWQTSGELERIFRHTEETRDPSARERTLKRRAEYKLGLVEQALDVLSEIKKLTDETTLEQSQAVRQEMIRSYIAIQDRVSGVVEAESPVEGGKADIGQEIEALLRLKAAPGEKLEAKLRTNLAANSPELTPEEITTRVDEVLAEVGKLAEQSARLADLETAYRSDERRLLRIFHTFRLRELVESRIQRKKLFDDIEGYKEDISEATKDGRFSQVPEFEEELEALKHQLHGEIHSSPEAYYDYWGQQLLELQRSFDEQGKIYETRSVKAKIGKILSILQSGQPVFIHGETGSGKTEIAKYIARHYICKDQAEAVVISGRRSLDFSEMTETRNIQTQLRELPENERQYIMNRIQATLNDPNFQQMIAEWAKFRGMDADEVKQREIEKLEAGYLEYLKQPLRVQSDLHGLYKAAEEDVPVIIDEMNAIPHHTLIAFNDLLTKKPLQAEAYKEYKERQDRYKRGEISLEETIAGIPEEHIFRPAFGHDPIVIGPRFCVMATGNWKPEDGINYVGRQALDTAFMRRFGVTSYDYLPNPVDDTLDDPDRSPEEERALKENAELYRMMCARVINSDLTAEVPTEAFDELERLAQVAKIVQDAFSGNQLADMYLPDSLTGSQAKLKAEEVIRENVLDIGKIVQYVIGPWKKDGFRYPLETYIFDRFITRSARPTERVYLYKLFQMKGFFNPEAGWPSLVDLMATQAPVPADPNQPADPNAATPVDAASMQRLQNQRLQEVLAFGNRLEKVLYDKPLISYNQETVEQIKRPELQFYTASEVIDRIVGRGPERVRYPNLSAAILQEGEAEASVEMSEEELADRAEIRTWRDEIEAYALDFDEKNPMRPDGIGQQILNQIPGAQLGETQRRIAELHEQIKEQLKQLEQLLDSNAPLDGEEGVNTAKEKLNATLLEFKKVVG